MTSWEFLSKTKHFSKLVEKQKLGMSENTKMRSILDNNKDGARTHARAHANTHTHTWIHKCVTKTVGCGTSCKYTAIHNFYSVKYYLQNSIRLHLYT
jgi:hypothetical protein